MSDKYLNMVALQALWDGIKNYVSDKMPPILTQGNWRYRIYDDSAFEAWYKATEQSVSINYASGNFYRSNAAALYIPSNISNKYDIDIQHADVNVAHNNYPTFGMLASISDISINYYALSGASRNANSNHTITAYVFGTLNKK